MRRCEDAAITTPLPLRYMKSEAGTLVSLHANISEGKTNGNGERNMPRYSLNDDISLPDCLCMCACAQSGTCLMV